MNELKKQFKLAKWDSILISVIVIAVGVLCIAMPDRSADVLCIVFGCSLLAIGITVFVKSVLYGGLFTSTAIVLSISITVTGIFCLVNPYVIQSILTVLFGLFILLDSAQGLADGIDCARAGISGWVILVITSALTMVLGIIIMFYTTFESVMIITGIALVVEGVRRLVITLTFSAKVNKAKKQLGKMVNEIYEEPLDENEENK